MRKLVSSRGHGVQDTFGVVNYQYAKSSLEAVPAVLGCDLVKTDHVVLGGHCDGDAAYGMRLLAQVRLQ